LITGLRATCPMSHVAQAQAFTALLRSVGRLSVTDAELIMAVETIRDTMIDVATGGRRIPTVNDEFRARYGLVAADLAKRRIENPLTHGDLWDWYARWTSGDMPTYQSRRTYVNAMCNPLINRIRSGRAEDIEPTGWTRVDRTVGRVRDSLAAARTEEDFQTVGLLCREALISLAQAVYVAERHRPSGGVPPSDTDVKRLLDAYVAVELQGKAHEASRKHIRSALDLAVGLQHKRTAAFRDAAMCVEATTAVVNIVAIISGRRDPQ
jgi:hypothetical protein